jgi:hypothetical protein
MNTFTKRVLLCTGLLIPYWALLFNYQHETEQVLQVLGSTWLGFLMYDLASWLVPKEAK